MNNVTGRKAPEPAPQAPGAPRGRPGVWADGAERQRAYRQRRQEQVRLVGELLHAVRNAHWEEPEVQQVMHWGEDAAVLEALVAYYRARHWQHRQAGG
jgi:hypothetical protein